MLTKKKKKEEERKKMRDLRFEMEISLTADV